MIILITMACISGNRSPMGLLYNMSINVLVFVDLRFGRT